MNKLNNHIQGVLQFNEYESYEVHKEKFNTNNLYKYGIYEEESDVRAHVTNQKIFVFKTKELIGFLSSRGNEFEQVPAYQPNYNRPTAYGYKVPIRILQSSLENSIREIKFISWDEWVLFNEKWSTTDKGRWAVRCIIELIKLGRFPFWLEAKQNDDIKIDIKGTDILIVMNQRIQVKCDYPAFKTGNLFIQTHEVNPYKLH